MQFVARVFQQAWIVSLGKDVITGIEPDLLIVQIYWKQKSTIGPALFSNWTRQMISRQGMASELL